ncbi:hybrid sensor histidine kinase/response regulator [bacterium]|nr:hybrid sensor histidine kinase/response regulator [bacterium]
MNPMPDAASLKILIVDDRPSNIASLRQVLERDDMSILAAGSGEEALALMLDHDFALVLLDVQMPGMDGFEVAELMRRHPRTRDLPVIFVTAINKERRHISSGYDVGAIDYLFKPVDPHVIRAKVAAFLNLKRAQLAQAELVAELNAANARLQEISDLKSDYLSAASHEFRTPLTVIREFCSLVHDGVVGEVSDEQRKCLASALRNCDRLAGLVNDLLDLDSIESGAMRLSRERVDIAALIRSCVEDFSGRCRGAGQEIAVATGDGAPVPPVLAAPDMVTQVLVNLVGNAHKFTPEGGKIAVSARAAVDMVEVTVADDGPGIAPEDRARAFEKFAQLNRRDGPGAKGTGLGLPISRKIVELHGGSLELLEDDAPGCRFRFSLPVYSHPAHLAAFVGDATHSPTGMIVPWTLVLLEPDPRAPWDPAALESDLVALVRSSDDRVGVVHLGERPVNAFVLKTDAAGAASLAARLEAALGKSYPEATPRLAIIDVTRPGDRSVLDHPELIELQPVEWKGAVHV